MKPIVDGLREEYRGRVEIEKFNIDDPDTKEARVKYRFRAQPYLVLLDAEGKVVTTWQGYVEKAVLEDAFAAVLEE